MPPERSLADQSKVLKTLDNFTDLSMTEPTSKSTNVVDTGPDTAGAGMENNDAQLSSEVSTRVDGVRTPVTEPGNDPKDEEQPSQSQSDVEVLKRVVASLTSKFEEMESKMEKLASEKKSGDAAKYVRMCSPDHTIY